MTEPAKSSHSRGKWLAAALVLMGIIAALAEWKFRPPDPGLPPRRAVTTAPTP